jgi:1-aminocyclopropane-1-carboxylate deaminase/D-cysteine desulfhydrase-like pyridoxal-dependent ACC family enzyme
MRVLAVSVQQPASFIRPLILERAAEALALLGDPTPIDPLKLIVDDRFVAPGYGRPSPEGMEALAIAGRTAGLVLDPAYTAKALACLRHRLAAGESTANAPTVFVHTGSAPGLFAHSAAVAAELWRSGG